MSKQKLLLKNVQLNKYKSIETVQTFSIEKSVTTLVGKNEAGKTAALEAIAKTNYFESDPKFKFDATYDYPRKEKKRFDKSGEDVQVAVCAYEISDNFLSEIQASVGAQTFTQKSFKYAKQYLSGNGTYLDLSADRQKFISHKLKVNNITDKDFEARLFKLNTEAEITALAAEVTDEAQKKLLGWLPRYFKNEWKWTNPIAEFIARTFLDPARPKFLYYDQYYELPSEIEITKLQAQQLEEEELKTSKALFELADINVDDLIKDDDYEPYKAELEATSNEITGTLFKYWQTNTNLRVEFDIQKQITPNQYGQQIVNPILKIRVFSQKYQMSLPLASRSKGFNWFFSFIVWFSKIQEDKDSNYILLLDEPGLNLHATAQEDLRRFIEDLSESYQVIYTTHSPFMIDPNRLERVRTVLETDTGTQISESIQEKDPDTLFPLQAALGYDIAQNLFINKNNLLIEGPSDLLYLSAVSEYLRGAGREGLKEDITLVPVGGLDKVTAFISLLRGQKLNIACLLDTFTDQKGKTRVQDLIQQKIIKEKHVRFFDEFVGGGTTTADLEDLFTKAEYLKLFNPAFPEHKDLKVGDLDAKKERVIEQINSALGIKRFNHYRPAYELAKKGMTAKTFSDGTLDKFEVMFEEVNKLF
jgi:predicted ATP-dependent endonuclease of OLD family